MAFRFRKSVKIAPGIRLNVGKKNEYSHLEGIFERNVLPIDVPEMKTTANFILRKIKEKDPDQYSALLQSIGVTEKLTAQAQSAVEVQ